jgi:hypothetical protein
LWGRDGGKGRNGIRTRRGMRDGAAPIEVFKGKPGDREAQRVRLREAMVGAIRKL